MNANTTLTNADFGILFVCTAEITVTLPPAAGGAGKKIYIVNNVPTGTVTVQGSGGETINGASTYLLTIQYAALSTVSDGSEWYAL